MDIRKIKAVIECLLFVTGDPVSLKELSIVLEVDQNTLRKIINQLIDDYNDSIRGIKIIE
ncbi:MAG: SMC-Scp complex subunit ScpB, partial [Lutispora sp.]